MIRTWLRCKRYSSSPAVAAPTHRTGYAVAFENFLEVFAGVLTAAVAVKYQVSLLTRVPLEPRHAQGIDEGKGINVRSCKTIQSRLLFDTSRPLTGC